MSLDFEGQKTDTEAETKRLRKNPLMGKTSAQIDAYVDAFTDIDDVKDHLKILTKAIVILLKRLPT